jgi:two-component system chemotaxis response regulator CheB
MTKPVRVLIVDDSALVREILAQGLGMDAEIEVIGTAANPYVARDKIIELEPDVLTLDVEMPKMDGVEFLRKLMPQHPMPVVMVSALTKRGAEITLAALEAGAVDFVTKPSTDVQRGLNVMMAELRIKVKHAKSVNLDAWQKVNNQKVTKVSASAKALSESTDKVIAIGASTGGTEAIRKIILALPQGTPGIVVVQHMPAGFTKTFADSINDKAELEVREAVSGDRVLPGRVLIAPGGRHLRIVRSGGFYLADCRTGENVNGHCPSVDVLFHSVAEYVGRNAIGIILTGMGGDGAHGLLEMRHAGAKTLGQDEASCVVYGMPKKARELGAIEFVAPLASIPQKLMGMLAN